MSDDKPICNNGESATDDITPDAESGSMPAKERRNMVLSFLVESELALPRKVIFRNMKYQGATFSEASLKNYLKQLRDDELIARIDAKGLENGDLSTSEKQAGYYIPTAEGEEYIDSESDDTGLVWEG